MNASIYRYEFPPDVSMPKVSRTLLDSMAAIECLYGGTQLRLDGVFHVDSKNHSCVVGGWRKVGRDLARIFTGFLLAKFGENGFKVTRITNKTIIDAETKAPKYIL